MKAKIQTMIVIVLALAGLASPSFAQYDSGYTNRPSATFIGGNITAPILSEQSGCVNPQFSWLAQPTWGLCRDGSTGIRVRSFESSSGKLAELQTSTALGDPATIFMKAASTGAPTVYVSASTAQANFLYQGTNNLQGLGIGGNGFSYTASGSATLVSGSLGFATSTISTQKMYEYIYTATPANVINATVNVVTPELTTTVTDGTNTGQTIINPTESTLRNVFGIFTSVVQATAGAAGLSIADGSTTQVVNLTVDGLKMSDKAFADLGTPANGTVLYCTDCTITAVCAGVGTGALAKRLGGVWVCN